MTSCRSRSNSESSTASRCYVVKVGEREPGGEREYSISPKQGYLPISMALFTNGKKYASHDLDGVCEVAPGIWCRSGSSPSRYASATTDASRLSQRRRIQIVSYQPRLVIPPDAFSLDIPYGVDVVD